VIGVSKESPPADLTHELAHALFFTDAQYRARVVSMMRRFDTRSIRRELRELSYSPRVITDEVHAYLISGDASVKGLANPSLRPLRRSVRRVFKQRLSELRITLPPPNGARRTRNPNRT
jgi:hypothetical protein